MNEQSKKRPKVLGEAVSQGTSHDQKQIEASENTDDGFMGAEHFEGMGNVWSALFGKHVPIETAIAVVIPTVIAQGKPSLVRNASGKGAGMDAFLMQYPENGSVRAGVLLVTTPNNKNWEVCSAYPLLEGKPVALVIKQKHTWANDAEGIVAARMASGGYLLSFFAPFYLRDFADLALGHDTMVNISALAFSLSQAEPEEFAIHEGVFYEQRLHDFLEENPEKTEADFSPPVVSLSGAKLLFPAHYTCEWQFRCPVLAVEEVFFMDIKLYKLTVDFVGTDDDVMSGYLYASERILNGYIPAVGHDVEGCMWMTGTRTEK